MVTVDIKGHKFYMDGGLYNRCQKVKDKVRKNNDHVFIIDGHVGSGKSTLATQIALVCDDTFTVDDMHFDPDKFMDAAINARKYQVVILDEAYRAWSSLRALSDMTFRLNTMMMEIRQKNLIFIIVLPSFFDLNRTIAISRADTLIHVHNRPDGNKGAFSYYDDNKKKYLYIKGKKFYNYHCQKPLCFGTFSPHMALDESIYDQKKLDVLRRLRDTKQQLTPTAKKQMVERNAAVSVLYEDCNMSFKEMAEKMNERTGFQTKAEQLSNYRRDFLGNKPNL